VVLSIGVAGASIFTSWVALILEALARFNETIKKNRKQTIFL
jgi:hypothetical protein